MVSISLHVILNTLKQGEDRDMSIKYTEKERQNIRRRIGKQLKRRSGVIIYLCMDCGIIEYEDHIIPGGKKCDGCGYLMENEEPE
jgi:rubrerythrin